MKKVFLGLSAFGILGFFSGAFADNGDIISAFTNGRFNEKNANVKELNDEQMSQVVGGAYAYWKTERKWDLFIYDYYRIFEGENDEYRENYNNVVFNNNEVLVLINRYALKYPWSSSGYYQTSWLEVYDKYGKTKIRQVGSKNIESKYIAKTKLSYIFKPY